MLTAQKYCTFLRVATGTWNTVPSARSPFFNHESVSVRVPPLATDLHRHLNVHASGTACLALLCLLSLIVRCSAMRGTEKDHGPRSRSSASRLCFLPSLCLSVLYKQSFLIAGLLIQLSSRPFCTDRPTIHSFFLDNPSVKATVDQAWGDCIHWPPAPPCWHSG